jgi:hypothetical protein
MVLTKDEALRIATAFDEDHRTSMPMPSYFLPFGAVNQPDTRSNRPQACRRRHRAAVML